MLASSSEPKMPAAASRMHRHDGTTPSTGFGRPSTLSSWPLVHLQDRNEARGMAEWRARADPATIGATDSSM